MQYMLLIYDNQAGSRSAAELSKLHDEYLAFTQGIIKNGNFKGGDALEPSTTATTVKVRDGKTLMTDGPFAETKEQIVGYYIVEARDLDEAAAIASRIPTARTGGIEVRPVRKM
ncbi:MAG TPA: YciI family protein [Candidatus Binataceae bacterium]|nr:YciI family protein [Candidatus Binataceae bacterium]